MRHPPAVTSTPSHTAAPLRGGAIRAAELLATAAVLLATLLGTGWLVTRTGPDTMAGRFDADILRWVAEHRTGPLDSLSETATNLVSTDMVVGIGILSAVVGAAVLRRWWPAALMVLALVGELALFLATATMVGRPRPAVAHLDAALPPTSSFPSGHSAAAVCLFGGIAVVVVLSTRGWWRWIVVAIAALLVLAVAASRVYRAAHHPTDVLGGLVLGAVWLLAAGRAVGPAQLRTRRAAWSDSAG